MMDTAPEMKSEPPRPLMRELPPADPFPIEALGGVLAPAARAIHDRVQAPIAMCGQSVLAAATLAVQGHADVELPTRQTKPVANYFVTVAATGERKSTVDRAGPQARSRAA
jgi:putative DNA primase/helicase